MRYWRFVLLAGAAALAATPAAASYWTRPDLCRPAMEAQLARLGFVPGDIPNINIAVVRAMTHKDRMDDAVTGYDGWARVNSCNGTVVVRVDDSCRFITAFGRGGCRDQVR